MERTEHWLDESLSACLEREVNDIQPEVRRLLVNLCGSIRSLEKQLNLQDEILNVMYAGLQLLDPELANEYSPPDDVSLSNDGVLVRDEVS